jgi:hypothetical protein
MAEVTQQNPEPMGTAGKKPSRKRKPAAKTGGKLNRKKTDAVGMRTLREAAGKAVGENSAEITASLLKAILEGKLNSGKMLFELAELQPEHEDEGTVRRRWSVAVALAAEPEWQEPVDEDQESERSASSL